jgi:hypothetical protein
MNVPDSAIRTQLEHLLNGGGAHTTFDQVVANLPESLISAKPPGLPYTPWRLLEHLRIAQRDILDFCRNPNYLELPFPEGYWPAGDGPQDGVSWERSVAAFREDLRIIIGMVTDPSTDLLARIRWGSGQTVLREALLVADHNAYHIGELVVVRRLLGSDPAE